MVSRSLTSSEEELIKAATHARALSYAPYSGYQVGAAIQDDSGRVWTGCNIENASYGATMCAERVALFKLVSEGARDWRRLALVTEDGGVPCALCLQVLQEFTSSPEERHIICVSQTGEVHRFSFKELLPYPFEFASGERKQQ